MIFLILLMLLQPSDAKANTYTFADESMLCSSAVQHFEKKYQIEDNLLSTISIIETGKWSDTLQQKTAWPWTINAKGRGYFFATKDEAVKKVKELQAKGIKSIDVGCMQVNLVFHGKAFANIEEAFEPKKNVEYAAKYLTKLYSRRQDWMKAATDYHSKKPSKAKRYKAKILATMEETKPYMIALDERTQKEQNWWSTLLWGSKESSKNNIEVSWSEK